MALTLSDVPAGFTIIQGKELIASDMNESAIQNGWKKGYSVVFERSDNGLQNGDHTILSQSISVYPIENLNQVMTFARSEKVPIDSSVKFTQLPDPGIGDSSQAFELTEVNGVTDLYISFVKEDVHENLYMNGRSVDYETLKNLAKASASKIR
jgi:hypothetical protein